MTHFLDQFQLPANEPDRDQKVITPCGLTAREVGEDWTDDIEGIECDTCRAHVEAEVTQDEREWRHEIAIEEGMLQGIDAYNEVMGWD